MKRSLLGILMSASLVSLFSVSCGSDGGGTVTEAQAVASCEAYCDAYIAKKCTDPVYTSAAECKTEECDPAGSSAACLNAVKPYYDCAKTQSDICEGTGCTTQLTAAISACPPPS